MPQQNMFGRLLQQTREAAGIGRTELAKRTSLDPSHVYRLELGSRRPSREAVISLAECLGLTSEQTNEWLLVAGYAPVSLSASTLSAVRTRGGGHRPSIAELLTSDWNAAHWAIVLEAIGLEEAAVRRLLLAMQSAPPTNREEVVQAMQTALSNVTVSVSAPVRVAIIPLAGGQHRLLAPHIMQKSILRMIGEAADSGINRAVLVLPPGADDQLYSPLKECLSLAVVPHMQLAFTEQAHPLGLGDAVLQAERLIGDEPFAVMLPDDVVHDRTGRTFDLQELHRMRKAFVELGGPYVIAVTGVPRSKMPRCGVVQLGADEVLSSVHPILRLVEKPEPAHPICHAAHVCGVVGRYLLTPDIFRALHEIKEQGNRPVHLTDALQLVLAAGQPVFSVTLSSKRQDVGEVLGQASALLGE